MIRRIPFSSLVGLCAVVNGLLFAADQPVDFERDIAPLLKSRCAECHGSKNREGGLRFLSRSDVLQRNDSGVPAVIPGNSGNSQLIHRITSTEERMPPEGEALSQEQVQLLKRWIEEGANWPDSAGHARHWSYLPPVRPLVPEQETAWGHNSIDSFIQQKLSQSRLSPAPVTDPARLLRRVSLDLIGIPPTPGQVDAFAANPTSGHLEQIVDELLASPRYGEKWARSWLDLARYADSNGFQADQFRAIWAYRDWVIQAMNADMPFDQFTIQQVAGDLLPEADIHSRIATGFHRCTTCNVEAGVDPEENRVNQIIDRINTTGIVWLGTSLECTQCHNHKYDPFTQQDYYQLFAFFNNTPLEVEQQGQGVQFEVSGPKMELPLDPAQAQRRQQLLEQVAAVKARQAARREELIPLQSAWEDSITSASESPRTWHNLEVQEFASTGGATHTILDDNSILVGGPNPAKDTYRVTFHTKVTNITGFKLEALTHDSLPGTGPGRGDVQRPNFVLTAFELVAGSVQGDGELKPVPLRNAQASFSQAKWDVAGLIDPDPKTGWAINPQFGKPHWATFETLEPIGSDAGTRLILTLPQEFGASRTMGRFRVQAMTGKATGEGLSADILTVLSKPIAERTPEEQAQVIALHQQSDAALAAMATELQKLDSDIQKISADTTLVMVEQDQPRMTSIFKRGNFLDPLAAVHPDTPAALHDLPATTSKDRPNRLDFARWLVSPDNPLVARVTVNRWWAEFFGQGIVSTLEDFGSQGELPTHPELLDWLAVEFMESGWSMKHIHKLIVLSATYQQDSRVNRQHLQRDPLNKLYSRGPRVRMPAETIRDNALAVSGLLSTKMGGPPVYPPQPEGIWKHVGRNAPKYDTDTDEDRFRRGIYVIWRRSAPYPSFVNFDAPDRGACVVNRSRTNTPLQALTLLNDPAYVEMAFALARRMARYEAANDRERMEYGFRCVLSRTPTSDETTILVDLFEAEASRWHKTPEQLDRLLPVAMQKEDIPRHELAAWFEVANVLLNLDECITKN